MSDLVEQYCTCMEIYGEDVDCPSHGIETQWSVENRDSSEWQEIAVGLSKWLGEALEAATELTRLRAQVAALEAREAEAIAVLAEIEKTPLGATCRQRASAALRRRAALQETTDAFG